MSARSRAASFEDIDGPAGVSKECLERLMGQVRSLADATGKHTDSGTDIDPIIKVASAQALVQKSLL